MIRAVTFCTKNSKVCGNRILPMYFCSEGKDGKNDGKGEEKPVSSNLKELVEKDIQRRDKSQKKKQSKGEVKPVNTILKDLAEKDMQRLENTKSIKESQTKETEDGNLLQELSEIKKQKKKKVEKVESKSETETVKRVERQTNKTSDTVILKDVLRNFDREKFSKSLGIKDDNTWEIKKDADILKAMLESMNNTSDKILPTKEGSNTKTVRKVEKQTDKTSDALILKDLSTNLNPEKFVKSSDVRDKKELVIKKDADVLKAILESMDDTRKDVIKSDVHLLKDLFANENKGKVLQYKFVKKQTSPTFDKNADVLNIIPETIAREKEKEFKPHGGSENKKSEEVQKIFEVKSDADILESMFESRDDNKNSIENNSDADQLKDLLSTNTDIKKVKSDADILKDFFTTMNDNREKPNEKLDKRQKDWKMEVKSDAGVLKGLLENMGDNELSKMENQNEKIDKRQSDRKIEVKSDASVLKGLLENMGEHELSHAKGEYQKEKIEQIQSDRKIEVKSDADVLKGLLEKMGNTESSIVKRKKFLKKNFQDDLKDELVLNDMLDNMNNRRNILLDPKMSSYDATEDISGDFINDSDVDKRSSFLKNVDVSRRLNIFTKEDCQECTTEEVKGRENIMDVIDSCEYRQMVQMPSVNQFEEWMMLTKDKKLWKFPIDNEQDSEELTVGFHEHVFPQQYLSGRLPKTGLVAQYMNLVVVGLSQSPYLTVAKKKAHIKWYEDYLSTKLDIINNAIEKSKDQQLYEDSLRKK